MNETEDAKPEAETENSSARPSFWSELKRRHVLRVASVYSVVAWLVIQVAGATFESFGIPLWAFRFVVLMLILGLPFTLVITWALELTPEGVKLTPAQRKREPVKVVSATLKKKRRWFSAAFAAAVPTLIFGTLALVFYLRQGNPSEVEALAQPVQEAKSIAVLPLLNMSEIGANAFFASGVHEDILTNLSRIDGLKVVSRTSVMRYINSEMSLREMGEELGVNYIVEGSVRRINNHVRVTVQLIDARNDTHLWANNYDRELLDVFATQSAVAREISNSLHLEIQPESVGTLQGMPTHSVKAYDLYLKARSIDRSELPSEEGLIRQRNYLEEALQEDPDFVEAWAVLNEVYDHMLERQKHASWFVGEGGEGDAMQDDLYSKSVRALKKAMALDPDNLETLIARASGVVGEEILQDTPDVGQDNSVIRREMMDLIITRHPDSAMGWYISAWWYNLNAHDNDIAAQQFKKALELDPLHARIVENTWSFFRSRADAEMVAMLYDRLKQIAPEKGSEQHLGKITPRQRLSAFVTELVATTDPAMLESIASLLSSTDFKALDEITALQLSAEAYEILNDQQRLEQLPIEPVLNDDSLLTPETSSELRHSYIALMNTLLRMQLRSATPEEAVQTAAIIEAKMDVLPERLHCEHVRALLVQVYGVLGRQDEAWAMMDTMRPKNAPFYSDVVYTALAFLDLDQAVEHLLKTKAEYPSWNGIDYTPIYHLRYRNFLLHPDMQAYYVKQGKWIDYLADRIPEYEQYRK